jgi:hypothetical protein
MNLYASATDAELLAFVESWIDDLAQGDYESAYSKTDHDPYHQWTPRLMRAVVAGYGMPAPHRSGTVFRVTSRDTATGEPHHRTIYRHEIPAPAVAEIWYDLPLNGAWSDLTATFRVETRGATSAVVLQEIHVF